MHKPHSKPVTASAVATITVEVHALGSWGTDCSVEQVHRQAGEEAVNYLRNLAKISGTNRLRVVGSPEIKTIIVERNK